MGRGGASVVAQDSMNMLESLNDLVDGWAQSMITDEDELQKVQDVLIIVNLLYFLFLKKFKARSDNSAVEPSPVGVVEQKFAC